ncbi:MAG: sn-glycerol-3-phosphate ABC transporter ATP-binding protein UgpC [Kiloniellales bacterium]|nr:sn-glycerol-3-phosphate ABC transporter ATP-binding protein UgpC [Kiloniellales bacterium]
MTVDVTLSGVNKYFGVHHVVRDVELTFPAQRFVTLLGPSGCGKTTLLRMIAGLEKVTRGSILFGERRVNLVRPGQRDVAMVFQSYALYPHMNVFNNIAYGLRVRRTPREELRRKVAEVAEVLEIGHLLDRKPRHLSGGQRQRVALGRAMVRDPVVFLMDEPLSNLDAKLRVTMRSELKRFHLQLGTTTVYVTHDQLEAMTMSDLIAVMKDGAVQQFATPQEIYNRPANLFVAGFIGNPPMNFLDVSLAAGAPPSLRLGDAVLPLPQDADLRGLAPDSRLTLGVRPQALSLVASDRGDALQGQVDLVELLGSEKLIEVSLIAGQRLVVQVRAEVPVAMGDRIGVVFDAAAMHLFEPQEGLALRRSGSASGPMSAASAVGAGHELEIAR